MGTEANNQERVEDKKGSKPPPAAERLRIEFVVGTPAKPADGPAAKTDVHEQPAAAEKADRPTMLRGSSLEKKIDAIISDGKNSTIFDQVVRDSSSHKDEFFAKLLNRIVVEKKKDPLSMNVEELSEASREALISLARDELNEHKYGEAISRIYSAYVDHKNDEVNKTARQLISKNVDLPPGCPIEAKINPDSKDFFSAKESLDRIAAGKDKASLPNHKGPVTRDNIPSPEEIDQLSHAERWLEDSRTKLDVAQARNDVRLFKETVNWLSKGKPPAGWLPDERFSDREAKAFVDRATPYLDVMAETNYSIQTIMAFERQAKEAGVPSLARTADFEKNFPGTIDHDSSGRITGLHPFYPASLERNEANLAKLRALQEWNETVGEKLQQIAGEYAGSNKDKVCYWADVPMHGYDKATNEEYNHVKYRTEAEWVKAEFTRPDGSKGVEDRIKVTTVAQKEWRSSFSYHGKGYSYPVGKPETSGFASVNDEQLKPDEIVSLNAKGEIVKDKKGTDDSGAQIRLGKNGNIQVLATGKNVVITDADGKTEKLAVVAANSDQWVDMLPGYSLSVGDNKIDLKNDQRLYKPDDLVILNTNGSRQALLARDLSNQISMNEFREFADFAVPLAMDVAFLAMGIAEFRAAYLAAREAAVALEITAEVAGREMGTIGISQKAATALAAMERGGIDAARRSAFKHMYLGAGGLAQQGIENWGDWMGRGVGLDEHFGHHLNQIRSLVMMTDIGSGAPVLGRIPWLKKWSEFAHADPKLLKTMLDSASLLSKANSAASSFVKYAGWIYALQEGAGIGNDITGIKNNIVDSSKQAEQEQRMKLADMISMVAAHKWERPLAEHFVGMLSEEDKKYIENSLRDVPTLRSPQRERDQSAYKFAKTFLDKDASEREKLASALGLLKIRQREDGSTPSVLAGIISDKAEGSDKSLRVTSEDIDQFLMNYRPVNFDSNSADSLADRYFNALQTVSGTFTNTERDLLMTSTIRNLKLPADDPHRQKHIVELSSIFQDENQSSKARLAAGVGLLFVGADQNTGAVKQNLGIKNGWTITYEVDLPDLSGFVSRSKTVFGPDMNEAADIARNQICEEFSLPRETQNIRLAMDGIAKAKKTVTSAEVLRYVRQQLASVSGTEPVKTDKSTGLSKPNYAYSADTRLALANLLRDTSQIGSAEMAGVGLEILKDPGASIHDKTAALSSRTDRLVEGLAFERFGQEIQSIQKEKDKAISLMSNEMSGGEAGPLSQALLTVANDQTQAKNIRAMAAAILDISRIPDAKQRTDELAAIKALSQKSGGLNSQSLDFASEYASHLLSKLSQISPQSTDRIKDAKEAERASLCLSRLNASTLINLSKLESPPGAGSKKELVFDSLLHTLDRNINELHFSDRPAMFQAINELSARFSELNLEQKHKLRETITNILKTDNKVANIYKDMPGIDGLKMLAMNKVPAIFADIPKAKSKDKAAVNAPSQPEKDLNSLVDALKANIQSSLSSPKKTGADTVEASQQNRAVVKGAIEYLAALALEKKNDAGSLSNTDALYVRGTFDLFMRLASAPSNRLDNPDAPNVVDPHIKVYALEGLDQLRSLNTTNNLRLDALTRKLLQTEKDVVIREAAEKLRRIGVTQNPVASAEQYQRAKDDIEKGNKTLDLKAAEVYIARFFSDALCDYDSINSPDRRLGSTLTPKEKEALLERRINQTVENILERSPEHAEIYRNVMFLLASNRSPIIPEYRQKAAELAARGWSKICREGNPAIRESMAPLTALLMSSTAKMPREAHEQILRSLANLAPPNDRSNKPLFTRQQVANIVSADIMQTLTHMPQDTKSPNYRDSVGRLLASLDILKEYQTQDQIPLLAALASEKFKSTLELDEKGLPSKRIYADGSSRSVERKDGQIISFTFTNKSGKTDKWVKDGDSFYKPNDILKSNPWNCSVEFLANGSFVIKDAPDKYLRPVKQMKPMFTVLAEPQKPEEAFAYGRSPGGTLTSQYGSETIYRDDGAKTVSVGFPAHARDGENITGLWVQTAEADGWVHSERYERRGQGWMPSLFVTGNGSDKGERVIPEMLLWKNKKADITPVSDDLSDLPVPVIRKRAQAMLASLTPLKPAELIEKGDKIFKEQQRAVRLAIAAGERSYLAQANGDVLGRNEIPNSLSEAERYELERRYTAYGYLKPGEQDLQAKTIAESQLGNWWLLGYEADYAGALRETKQNAQQQLRLLRSHASLDEKDELRLGKPGQGNNARLAEVYLAAAANNKEIIDAIAVSCSSGGPNSAKMTEFVANEMIIDPTIDSASRKILFDALTKSGIDKAEMAGIAARALEVEYQVMPRQNNSTGFQQSEDLQVAILNYLQKINDRSNLGRVRALYDYSPSQKVYQAAKRLLISAGEKVVPRAASHSRRGNSNKDKTEYLALDLPSEFPRLILE